jgi:hypothetical protein
MSFYHLPNPWNPNYAIPDYVMAEPPGRGTFTTKWLPRGTIPDLIPDFLAKPGQKILGRGDAGLGSLGGNTLEGNSLAENSLARNCFAGNTLGADDEVATSRPAPRRAQFYAPTGAADMLTNPWVWVLGLGAYLWWSNKKKSGGSSSTPRSASLGSYSKKHFKKRKTASSGGLGSLSDAERQRRMDLMQNPRRRRRARRSVR